MTKNDGAKHNNSSSEKASASSPSATFLKKLSSPFSRGENGGEATTGGENQTTTGGGRVIPANIVDSSNNSATESIDILGFSSNTMKNSRSERRLQQEDVMCSSSLGKLSLEDWGGDEFDSDDEFEPVPDGEGGERSLSPRKRGSSTSIEAVADVSLQEALVEKRNSRDVGEPIVEERVEDAAAGSDGGEGGAGLDAGVARTGESAGDTSGVADDDAKATSRSDSNTSIIDSHVIALPHSPEVKNPKVFTHAPPVGLGGAGRTLAAAYQASESISYKRAIIPEPSLTHHDKNFCMALVSMLEKRKNYLYKIRTVVSSTTWDPKILEKRGQAGDYIEASPMSMTPFHVEKKEVSNLKFKMENGVFMPVNDQHNINIPVSANVFFSDLHDLSRLMNSAPYHTFAHRRLKLLQEKFSLYQMLNAEKEFLSIKALSHRDFYNVRKIDNHVHHSACMNQKHLLRFIKKRVRDEGDVPVIERDGKKLTLNEVFESLGLFPYDLNIDVLDMHAHNTKNTTFHRFDKFNQKFSPSGEARLREIFLKTNNYVKGRYLADITKEVFEDLAASKYQMAEYRLSIYGKSPDDWSQLASWWYDHKLVSPNVVWMVQIPRLYKMYKQGGLLNNFGEFLHNIFAPLFEITRNPDKDPKLVAFLENVVGLDLVDDESQHERKVSRQMPSPENWDLEKNPAYNYYLYYFYANLYVLNSFRQQRNMSQFSFRPHAGEAGDVDHLAGTFLLANGINHGINLKKSPSLQYLYYLAQVGLAMSPLSNNCLFCEYSKNPFAAFFERGLNVSLTTDDPLLIHMTKEPLVEEYSIAMQVYKLSTADLSEIARNSVLQSGFPKNLKRHWVGGSKMFENNPYQSNVPNVRIQFRKETLEAELEMVYKYGMASTE
jgi:AMP deaminase